LTETKTDVAAPVAARADDGRFPKGTSGNPLGRPKKTTLKNLQQDLEIAFREHLGVDRFKRIVNRMADMAEQGDVKAAKLIFDKLVPNASNGESDDGEKAPQVHFVITNATFAAQAKEKEQVEVIDVTPTHVTNSQDSP
jgi:hypothetical protein